MKYAIANSSRPHGILTPILRTSDVCVKIQTMSIQIQKNNRHGNGPISEFLKMK